MVEKQKISVPTIQASSPKQLTNEVPTLHTPPTKEKQQQEIQPDISKDVEEKDKSPGPHSIPSGKYFYYLKKKYGHINLKITNMVK